MTARYLSPGPLIPPCGTTPNADFARMRSPTAMAMSLTRVRWRTSRGRVLPHSWQGSGRCALAHGLCASARDTLLLAAGAGERHDRAAPQPHSNRDRSPAAERGRTARAREGPCQSGAQAHEGAATAEPLGAPAGGPARSGRTHPSLAGPSRSSCPC